MKIYVGFPDTRAIPEEWKQTFEVASFRFLAWLFPATNQIGEMPSHLDPEITDVLDSPDLLSLYWRDIRRCETIPTPRDLVVIVDDFPYQGLRYEIIREGEKLSDPRTAVPVMVVKITDHPRDEGVPSWALPSRTIVGARSEKYLYSPANDAELAGKAVKRRALELGLDWKERER